MSWITVQLPAGRTVESEKGLVAMLTGETSRTRSRGGDATQVVIDEVQRNDRGTRGVLASALFSGSPGSGNQRCRKPS